MTLHQRITARAESVALGEVENHLDKFGPPGSFYRLLETARLDLGKRSEAARRAIVARIHRMKTANDIHL